MNAWGDFNDAAPLLDDGATDIPASGNIEMDRIPGAGQSMQADANVGPAAVDLAAITIFLDVAFGYCEGLIPIRGFVDQGQGLDIRPHNIWIPADGNAPELLATYATWAAREGSAVYVIPGTVAEQGQARAEHVLQMQTVVVDLDSGDINAKLEHLVHHLGAPTLLVESGGRTAEGAAKLHAWWRLTEPAEGGDLARLCALRGEIADKVGGDTHFRSAHQPIRVPGTVHQKHGVPRRVTIREHHPRVEVELSDFAAAVAAMPTMPGLEAPAAPQVPTGPASTPSSPLRSVRAPRTAGPASRAPAPPSATSSAWSTRAASPATRAGKPSANTTPPASARNGHCRA